MNARQNVRVVGYDIVADGVVQLVLEATGRDALGAWTPGAHIDVEVPSGLVRQYSLCGQPDEDEYRIAVLRQHEGRASREVHRLGIGTELRISAPRNDFVLRDSPGYVFVAGGIGITPLLPMIAAAQRRGAAWRLVYGGRTRATMAFADALVAAHGDCVHLLPEDEAGLMDLAEVLTPSTETLVYCCGPEGLLAAVSTWCDEHWPAGSLVLERFERGGDRVVAATPQTDAPLEVQLGHGGPIIDVPADRSILETLVEAGVDIFYSCQEGICGSCQTQVLDGTPLHRDDLLSPDERAGGAMLLCVSRASSKRLVLDLEGS